jgi:hypothetical protein
LLQEVGEIDNLPTCGKLTVKKSLDIDNEYLCFWQKKPPPIHCIGGGFFCQKHKYSLLRRHLQRVIDVHSTKECKMETFTCLEY